ncbi:hypothetical protein OHD27_08880 [Escherichia coli]|nr:hypothetical protein [Escherichia coli]
MRTDVSADGPDGVLPPGEGLISGALPLMKADAGAPAGAAAERPHSPCFYTRRGVMQHCHLARPGDCVSMAVKMCVGGGSERFWDFSGAGNS